MIRTIIIALTSPALLPLAQPNSPRAQHAPDLVRLAGGGFVLSGNLVGLDIAKPDTPACLGDTNGDGEFTHADIVDYLRAHKSGAGAADIDENGTVNTADLIGFLKEWAAGCP